MKQYKTEPIEIAQTPAQPLPAWVESRAQALGAQWLLAHADDGVIWGKLDAGKIELAPAAVAPTAPPLRWETIQQLRVFGEKAELHLWREGAGWRGRVITDDLTPDVINEDYLLWGVLLDGAAQNGFQPLREQDGLRHAPPLPAGVKTLDPAQQRLCLHVRHFVDYDDAGQAAIVASRLIKLDVADRRKEAR